MLNGKKSVSNTSIFQFGVLVISPHLRESLTEFLINQLIENLAGLKFILCFKFIILVLACNSNYIVIFTLESNRSFVFFHQMNSVY